MTDNDELEGFRPTRYFSRAWALLTLERGWIKPVLVMAVSLLVPIAGWLGVVGYMAEWSRVIAWGTSAAPKRHGIRVGSCIASGWRAFVVLLVWGICMSIITAVANAVPLFGAILGLAWWVFSFFLSVVIMVAVLRATIYQRIRAGLRVSTIWEMARHDTSGLLRILGMLLVGELVIAAIALVVILTSLASLLPSIFSWVTYLGEYGAIMSHQMRSMMALRIILELLGAFGPGLLVVVVVCGILGIVLGLLGFAAVGLWMRQFDVASWGREEEPPAVLNAPRVSGPAPSATPQDPTGPADEVVEATPVAVAPGAPSVATPAPSEPQAKKDAPADDGPSVSDNSAADGFDAGTDAGASVADDPFSD